MNLKNLFLDENEGGISVIEMDDLKAKKSAAHSGFLVTTKLNMYSPSKSNLPIKSVLLNDSVTRIRASL